MKSVRRSQVGGCHVGDVVTFSTKDREVTGQVVRLHFGESQDDYHEVYLNVDGMEYCFGTGGHLGDTWTTESGTEQWFKN